MTVEGATGAVTWSSDAEAIVKVAADGTMTAVAVGTANITATADGKSVSLKATITAA